MPIMPSVPDVAVAGQLSQLVETRSSLDQAQAELRVERLSNEYLQESLADIELMLEDRGWLPVGQSGSELSGSALKRARAICGFMGTVNPLIKRGLSLRCAYVWGLGVTITAKDSPEVGQDVNAVIQAFLDLNRDSFMGATARSGHEWKLGTDGEVFLAGETDPVNGAVNVKRFPADEIDMILTDPEDKRAPWYYLRSYTTRELVGGELRTAEAKSAYPAMGLRRRSYPPSISNGNVTYLVEPDTWVRHVPVNQAGEALRGIGDAFASIPWARAHKEFLEQWATLMRALARYAWKESTPVGKAKQEAQRVAAQSTGYDDGAAYGSGATFVGSPGYTLEAVPKTGATIDAGSGQPLAQYVAAGLGVPLPMLLTDPGITGARSVAETLDQPTELEMGARRDLWAEVITDICQHVIDSSVIAPQGPLKGRILYDPGTGLIGVELPEEDNRTIEVSWPAYGSTPVGELAKAISDVLTGFGSVPDAVKIQMYRRFLEAIGVDDIDDVIDAITDDEGNLLDADMTAGDVAAGAFRRGEDPAAALA